MSGAAALSAAKNRRSTGANISISKSSTQQTQQIQNNAFPAEKKELLHPLRVLQKHDLMLKKHDEELETLISINNENKSLNGGSSIENTEITKKLNDLEKSFKILHNNFDDAKKEINKVMSFSMGVNNELMVLKKEINEKIELLWSVNSKTDNKSHNKEEEVEHKEEEVEHN